jgi:hypothetical protein
MIKIKIFLYLYIEINKELKLWQIQHMLSVG